MKSFAMVILREEAASCKNKSHWVSVVTPCFAEE